ncbi:adenylate/guanylate cyclase domain-containing protein [Mycolicibacterium sp. F2034L]|uniref:adenylate/guanylate cyclase domain-containing protein n=1 Tax=Mycolicibacterium sp. F2034L TaxID=2926422 RepID=UPI001FF26151|nr:adenylate/guanylate cyclase domain-containing protein [Mycolicibacterium sp. F2034L]MCK0176538.1 adenylate/guanylate cyclase domain-containing protein [Mycolicibacterium sp. F2034L]
MSRRRRVYAGRLAAGYGIRLTLAHLTAAAAVLAIIVALSRNTIGDARQLLTATNLTAFIVLVTASATVDGVVGAVGMRPVFKWFAEGAAPAPDQQRAALRIPVRQTAVEFGVWVVSGAVFMVLNINARGGVAYVIGGAILFGAMTTACIGYLITARTLRPIISAAMAGATGKVSMPGAFGRLVYVWVLFTAVPAAGIAVIVLARTHGWFLHRSAPIETPILVMVAVSLLLGLGATLLCARSISDPIREVVVAMREVGQGRTDVAVAVYEPSEIGRLQTGFNTMVAGLAERERLRELFGRYVGVDVARHALQTQPSLHGDVREVAVLYVDLIGSTAMAASRDPDEVAQILNDFFQIVVTTVEQCDGLINKFQGDAVLAVFGAPLHLEDPAAAALAAARTVAPRLRTLPETDFGIGVTFGAVFAGTVGAENRYEYTVIGDPVNEAARLADRAKESTGRVLCSTTALHHAATAERDRWRPCGTVLLRGRSAPTEMAEPAD